MTTKINFAFLHGGGQGSWVWQETIVQLRKRADGNLGSVIALDIPGCGHKRDRDSNDLDFGAIVTELMSDLANAETQDVVLVGHSQAGTVMPFMAARNPDLFRHLVYITCSIPLPGQTLLGMIGDQVHGSNDEQVGWPIDPQTTSLQERFEIMFCNDMNEQQGRDFMGKLGNDQWPQSTYTETNWQFEPQESLPSTYVVCQQDNILPVSWQEKFARRFNVREILRVDAGHQVMITEPNAIAELLLAQMMFLSGQ